MTSLLQDHVILKKTLQLPFSRDTMVTKFGELRKSKAQIQVRLIWRIIMHCVKGVRIRSYSCPYVIIVGSHKQEIYLSNLDVWLAKRNQLISDQCENTEDKTIPRLSDFKRSISSILTKNVFTKHKQQEDQGHHCISSRLIRGHWWHHHCKIKQHW